MEWIVEFTKTAAKQADKMSNRVKAALFLLTEDLIENGPRPEKQWSNYGKLRTKKSVDKRHCHLIKGNPTYVCCWEVVDKKIRIIEVYYVGTHEKAPY